VNLYNVLFKLESRLEHGDMDFKERFQPLTGYTPYPWQTALYAQWINEKVPHRLHLPTGAGKTAIIPIWLCAVWNQLESGLPLTVPRRVYFAVDRRVVVDQSEVVAQSVRENAEGTPLWSLLSQRTLSNNPLIVSVLRGQRVIEYDDVISDPSAFAVILCTPDMFFSRLLGGAYGCSTRVGSREMGLVGQDSFIVLDEAHISEANIKVLEFVSRHNNSLKPFWWTTMSATLRQDADFTLSEDDRVLMAAKLNAAKTLTISEGDPIPTILNTIEDKDWKRLIIYVEKPSDAVRVFNKLQKQYSCLLLTGTMRGYEKSQLASRLSPFQTTHPDESSILIATSAGEVGLDISCDILITEIAAAERLAQRFGRCNRWGECKIASVYVINPPKKEKKDGEELTGKQAAIAATVEYLKTLDGDVSTGNLYRHPIPSEAFSPVPPTLSLNKASLLQIANTTYPSMEIADYIRGVGIEYHVNIVIRKDAEIKCLLSLAEADPTSEAFDQLPIANNELFKEIPRDFLRKIALSHSESHFFFISKSGVIRVLDASVDVRLLTGGTVFLPESANLINLQGICEVDGGGEGDIFSKVQSAVSRFVRTADDEWMSLETGETLIAPTADKLLRAVPVDKGMKARIVFNSAGLTYIKTQRKVQGGKMPLREHLARATECAQQLNAVIGFPPEIATAVVDGAKTHDDGKAHPLWQLAFRGTTTGEPLAKNFKFVNPLLLNGMRHELVSTLQNPELSPLATWLVVSHHGRCRPRFEPDAYDPDAVEASANLNGQLPELLSSLNQQYGVWGLAYLEAVIRAVDINAE
jgi:CRISPR-associated endonuclease/helicase Cas3